MPRTGRVGSAGVAGAVGLVREVPPTFARAGSSSRADLLDSAARSFGYERPFFLVASPPGPPDGSPAGGDLHAGGAAPARCRSCVARRWCRRSRGIRSVRRPPCAGAASRASSASWATSTHLRGAGGLGWTGALGGLIQLPAQWDRGHLVVALRCCGRHLATSAQAGRHLPAERTVRAGKRLLQNDVVQGGAHRGGGARRAAVAEGDARRCPGGGTRSPWTVVGSGDAPGGAGSTGGAVIQAPLTTTRGSMFFRERARRSCGWWSRDSLGRNGRRRRRGGLNRGHHGPHRPLVTAFPRQARPRRRHRKRVRGTFVARPRGSAERSTAPSNGSSPRPEAVRREFEACRGASLLDRHSLRKQFQRPDGGT